MDLLGGNIKKTYFKYLGTSIGGALVISVYSLVDCIMVGHYQGPDGTAALAIIMPIWTTILSLGILCGTGGAVLMSKLRGEGEKLEGDMYFTTATIFCAVLTFIVWMIILIIPEPLLRLFGANDNILPHAMDYIKYLKYFVPLFTFGQLFSSFIRNDNAPAKAMIAVVSGGIFNIVGDYLLVFTFDMGIAGAGLATSLGQVLGFSILISHFFSKKCTLKFVRIKKFFVRAGKILAVGFPTFIIDVAIGVTILLFNNQIMKYHGEPALAVYGIIVNVNYFVQSVAYGVGQSAQPLISINYGAKQLDRVKQTAKYAWISSAVVGIAFFILAESIPMPLTKLFMKVTPEVELIAENIMRLYCICYILLPINIFSTYYLQAIMKAKASMVISLLRAVVLSSILLFVLPAIFGKDGLWYVMTVTEALTFIVMIIITRHFDKKLVVPQKPTVVQALDSLFDGKEENQDLSIEQKINDNQN